jgi:hypothetical protein
MKRFILHARTRIAFITLIATWLLSSPAFAQTQGRDLGNDFVKFRARATNFKAADEACRYLREYDGNKYTSHSEDYEGRVTCKYKIPTKQGNKDIEVEVEQSGVLRVLECPSAATMTDKQGNHTANARIGTCMCDEQLVAAAGGCYKPEEAAAAIKAKAEKDAAAAKCTWSPASTQTGDTSKNSAILRKNLGAKPGDDLEAHHIVFSTWKAGQRGELSIKSRAILDKYCVDINSSDNGTLLTHGRGTRS